MSICVHIILNHIIIKNLKTGHKVQLGYKINLSQLFFLKW